MNDMAKKYPSVVDIFHLGRTSENRTILGLKVLTNDTAHSFSDTISIFEIY